MNTKSKKRYTFTLCMLLIVAAIVGCSNSGNKVEPTNTTNGNTAGGNEENPYKEKYDPAVSISTAWGVDPALTFREGETIDNNVATKWALETLGIKVESLWSVTDTNGAFATKMRLAMSSGQQMPDVVMINDKLLAQDLIDSGMFQDAGALFDKYAGEKWKTAMNLDSSVWNSYINDGKRMGIPLLDYAYNSDYLLWIRQDWLDKLNMKAPTTIAELETVMEAFKNNNPQGLAPDKVVPLSVGFKTSMSTWMGDPSWVFGAYGTLPTQWNVAEDGTLEYGSTNPGMKQGLIKLKEWRDKGYIPKEAALWDENKTSEPAVAGTAGIIPGPYWMSGWPLLDTAKNVEGAVWKPYAIPTGEDGTAMRHGTHFVNGVILINKNMKNPEAFFTYENYLFDNLADPQEGSPFENGVFEGYDYALDANGNPLYLDDVPGGAITAPLRYFIVRDGARIPDAQFKALLNLAEGNEAKTYREKEVVAQYGPATALAATVIMEQEDISKKDMFVGPATKTMKSRMDYLKKIEAQTFNEIIYGAKPAEAFDEFVKSWKSSGGDDITKEVNEWYSNVAK
ncbi:sugar ABC transporter [Paenibacillus sp. FSL H8-0548]|uniref:extracellular solute-binding protein n=1 Tax=Paenibacillus sp. FSL H8-0548 TaxID=1920422 RepID=UPI00096DDCBE|nr:extracellular solute-binding protein [Paenibacillus sp. FSL H8-0548]OMF20332.1 sugar ABC transporter [Paenibacillus sp. FSL H8-0548]